MLFVLGMLIRKARDVDTWRFFSGEQKPAAELADARSAQQPAATAAEKPSGTRRQRRGRALLQKKTSAHHPAANEDPNAGAGSPPSDQADAEPPLDEDPEERAALEEEFQAITDQAPLTKEEMFAYWRLLRWADATKLSDMLKRAHTVRYGDLILEPAEHRGQLIKIKLHVLQNLEQHAPPDNPAGVGTYYQAVGWNDSSQAWFYFCVYADLPPGMPVGDRIEQLGTFVGFFLKTLTYQDGQGKTVQAPVLIGRMVWHPVALSKPQTDGWDTAWLIAGVALVWLVFRFVLRLLPGRKRSRVAGLLRSGTGAPEPAESVENWLDRVESGADGEAINHPRGHESNGNPPGESLDRSDDQEG